MLYMKLIGNTLEELKKAKALYYRAFPKNERRSFPELVENRLGSTEVFGTHMQGGGGLEQ